MRAWAPVVAAILLSLQSDPVLAQAKPASDDNTGFSGIPDHTSSETGIPFFSPYAASQVDRTIQTLRQAAADCDRAAYDKAANGFDAYVQGSMIGMAGRRYVRDAENMRKAKEQFPPFPEPCHPPHQGGDRFHRGLILPTTLQNRRSRPVLMNGEIPVSAYTSHSAKCRSVSAKPGPSAL